MEGSYYEKYMKELVGIMLAVELSSPKAFVLDSFGQQQLKMQGIWFRDVTRVNSSLQNHTLLPQI
jgi:hypothetical protein